jgi:acetyl esterase/lipase
MRSLILAVAGLLLSACSPTAALNRLALISSGSPEVVRDRAFGAHPRQKLDVYAPDRKGGPKPVLVFLYGGAWNDGDKSIYGFAGGALASRGFVTVIPDYRLYPEVRYPAFLQDNAAAVRWARDHAAEFGGDPNRIVLMGHSAGAYNAAMLALDPRWLRDAGVPAGAVKAWAGLAGPYDFLPLDDEATIRTFGQTPELAETQPVNFVGRDDPPSFLATGGDDERVEVRHTRTLAAKLQAAGVQTQARIYPGVGHVGLVLALAAPFRGRAPVLAEATAFLRRQSAAPPAE